MSLVKVYSVLFYERTETHALGQKMLISLDEVRAVEEFKCEASFEGFQKVFRVTLKQGSILTVVSAYLDTLWQQTGP